MNRTAFLIASFVGVASVTAASAQTVGVGTGPAGSLTNRIGAAVAKVIADGADLKTRAVPHTSNSQHAVLVNKGALQFGVNTTQQVNAAIPGTDQFKGQPQKNFRMAARLIPLPVGTIVRKDSPYKTLADLKGKKYPSGFTAQKTVLFILRGFLNNAGLSEGDLVGVPVPNTHSASQLFLKGSVDGTLTSLGGARLRNADAKVGGIRILKMSDAPADVAAMQKAYPNSYLVELKPGKGTVGVEGPTKTMAFDLFLMTSTNTSDEVVYKAVKALHGGKAGLVKISKAFGRFNPGGMAPAFKGATFHPGAMKYYKEAGIWSGS